ncbi:MAG: ribosome silencing factor [Candidatus Omnitrophica bacterium]|nr:ribosome silencing factor [Candidatus Omnitrophota bacterium]
MRTLNKAQTIAGAASAKKALDIVIIDMRQFPTICDYFVIASGASAPQIDAIADNIAVKLRQRGQRLFHKEGNAAARWILLDYGDVVAHVFYEETRRFYDLERLWGDAPRKRFREIRRKKKTTHGKKKRRA